MAGPRPPGAYAGDDRLAPRHEDAAAAFRLSPARGVLAEAVAVVDVLAELDDVVGRGPGRDIDPVERHRLGHARVLALARLDDLVDLLARPAWRLGQQPIHQVAHVLHPHAAGRVETVVLAKQVLERRVMHVDAVRAGEVDAHGAERIEPARILLEAVVDRLLGKPVYLRRRQLAATLIEDAAAVFRQIVRLGLPLGDQVLAHG